MCVCRSVIVLVLSLILTPAAFRFGRLWLRERLARLRLRLWRPSKPPLASGSGESSRVTSSPDPKTPAATDAATGP